MHIATKWEKHSKTNGLMLKFWNFDYFSTSTFF